jgi:nucleoside phosphorylase
VIRSPFHAAARQAAIAAAVALALLGCGGDDGGGDGAAPPGRVAVLAAFPGELSALLARMRIEEHVTIGERNVRVGTLGGTPVVVAMTGIGLINAANTTAAVLDAFDVRGVVMAGVAGSPLNIADVAVPTTWFLPDGSAYPIDRRYQRIAERLEDARTVAFARCTAVPSASPEPVCMPNAPVLVVGGFGESEDPFGAGAFPCSRGDVFGCDAPDPGSAAVQRNTASGDTDEPPLIQDMETAAVAQVAAGRGVPFIAFRAVSDGAGDPLNLRGFPDQFYAYYPLAAHNAAAAAEAFVSRL